MNTRSPSERAAASEDRLKLRRELRTRLVDAVDSVTCVRDLEPLARRLDAVSAEIDDLAAMREPSGSPADVIAARRAERLARGEPVALSRAATRDTRLHG
jgi:hypothetical protein